MAKIYISHAKSDFGLAREISTRLKALGHELWSDENLKAGTDWRSQLQENLAEADAVVVLITEKSAGSQWVISEASTMLAYARERGRGGGVRHKLHPAHQAGDNLGRRGRGRCCEPRDRHPGALCGAAGRGGVIQRTGCA